MNLNSYKYILLIFWILKTSLIFSQNFTTEIFSKNKGNFFANSINCMQIDSKDNLWLGCEYGLISLSNSDTILINKINSSFPFSEISAIHIENDNSKYIGTYRGVIMRITPYNSVINTDTINNNYPINKIKAGDKLIVTSNNLLWGDCDKLILNNYINNLEYFDNSYWLSTTKNLYKIYFNFFGKIKVKKIRGFNNISYIYSDEEYMYIAGDKNGATSIWQTQSNHFAPILLDTEIEDISTFIFNENKLWVATHNKLYVLKKNNDKYTIMADTLMQANCMAIADTGIWVGTRQNGLIKIRHKKNEKDNLIPDINLISDSVVCNNYANSGGSEVSIKKMDLGKSSGIFILEYEMYEQPDKITIFSAKDKTVLFTTREAVSGNKIIKIEYNNTRYIIIRVDGNVKSTSWKYKIQCPD